MIWLDRARVVVPSGWASHVAGRLPDATAFQSEATRFEALDLDDPVRRGGFRAFAPQVLFPYQRKGKVEPDFPECWTDDRMRDLHAAIEDLSHKNCAYCQSDAYASHPGHIDHFKPKSLFPSLAYDPENYFLGCFWCNVSKGDRWPSGGYARPDGAGVTRRFVFFCDGSVEAMAGDGPASDLVEDFGLNRESLQLKRGAKIQVALKQLQGIVQLQGVPVDVQRTLARGCLLPETETYSEAVNRSVYSGWEAVFPGVGL